VLEKKESYDSLSLAAVLVCFCKQGSMACNNNKRRDGAIRFGELWKQLKDKLT
jgi:hypothetical protein